jgi:hypothetical protein
VRQGVAQNNTWVNTGMVASDIKVNWLSQCFLWVKDKIKMN